MKVGTDGVLLGAWADVTDTRRILDIGCGSGLIALMAAQRAPLAQVDGVEIDEAAAADARLNASQSPFAPRVRIFCADILTWNGLSDGEPPAERTEGRLHYDCLLSNPPYHEEDLLPPSLQRAAARHTAGGGLTFPALLRSAVRLLDTDSPASRLCLVLPAPALRSFLPLAAVHGLVPVRRTDVVTRPGKPPKRVLLEFRFPAFVASLSGTFTQQTDELVLVAPDGSRSAAYSELCRDFYL